MDYLEDVKTLIGETLQIQAQMAAFTPETPLLGAIPELDSMAVVGIITGIEEHFGVVVEDDEISATTFGTLGNLVRFVQEKMA